MGDAELDFLMELLMHETNEACEAFVEGMASGDTNNRCASLLAVVLRLVAIAHQPPVRRTIVDALSPAVWARAFSPWYTIRDDEDSGGGNSNEESARSQNPFERLFRRVSPQNSHVSTRPKLPPDTLLDDRFFGSQEADLTPCAFYTSFLHELSRHVFRNTSRLWDALMTEHDVRPLTLHLLTHLSSFPRPVLFQQSLQGIFTRSVGSGTEGANNLRTLFQTVIDLTVNFFGRAELAKVTEGQPTAAHRTLIAHRRVVQSTISALCDVITSTLGHELRLGAAQCVAIMLCMVPDVEGPTLPTANRAMLLLASSVHTAPAFLELLHQLSISVHDVLPLLRCPARGAQAVGILMLAHSQPYEELNQSPDLNGVLADALQSAGVSSDGNVTRPYGDLVAPVVSRQDADAFGEFMAEALEIIYEKIPAVEGALEHVHRAAAAAAAARRGTLSTPVRVRTAATAYSSSPSTPPPPQPVVPARPEGAHPDEDPSIVLQLHLLAELSFFDEATQLYINMRAVLRALEDDHPERSEAQRQCAVNAKEALLGFHAAYAAAVEHGGEPEGSPARLLASFLASLGQAVFVELQSLPHEALVDAFEHNLSLQARELIEHHMERARLIELLIEDEELIEVSRTMPLRSIVRELLELVDYKLADLEAPLTLPNVAEAALTLCLSPEGEATLRALAAVARSTSSAASAFADARPPPAAAAPPPSDLLRHFDEYCQSFIYFPDVVDPAKDAAEEAATRAGPSDAAAGASPSVAAAATPAAEGERLPAAVARFLDRYRRDFPESSSEVEMRISQENLIESTLESFGAVAAETLRLRRPRVYFVDDTSREGGMQQGIDQGGLRRAWMDSLGQQLAQWGSMLGLLRGPPGQLFIHPMADLLPEAEWYFKLLGRALAVCLINADHGILFPAGLSPALFSLLLGRPLRVADHDAMHEDVVRNIRRGVEMLAREEMTAEDLALTHSCTVDLNDDMRGELRRRQAALRSADHPPPSDDELSEFEQNDRLVAERLLVSSNGYSTLEFVPGGSERTVEAADICDHLAHIMRFNFAHYSPRSVKALVQGFRSIIPLRWLSQLDPISLAVALEGSPVISIEDWRRYAKETARTPAAQHTCELFWQIVADMNDQERAQLLCFVTAQTRLPPGGFSCLLKPFHINVRTDFVVSSDNEMRAPLPVAHSCYNQLEVVAFKTREIFAQKLRDAMHVTDFLIR